MGDTRGKLKSLWYEWCHWLCRRVYFERVTLVHLRHLAGDSANPLRLAQSERKLGGATVVQDRQYDAPPAQAVLYVVLHRNGAVDGFIYGHAVPRGIFLVSTQLLRGFFGRLFFTGIAVARKQDQEDGSHNAAALRECVRVLAEGGELMVFPEGSSSLGPRHLPFKSGAARLALDALA